MFQYDPSPLVSPIDGENYYYNEIVFLSDGFLVNGSDMTGTGNAIALKIFGVTETLDIGTYTGINTNKQAFNFWNGTIYTNTTIGIIGSGQAYNFTSGEITVTKSDDIYTIHVTGMADGKPVAAKYVGTIILREQ